VPPRIDRIVMHTIEEWFDAYSHGHQDPRNRAIHGICVPVIVWCVIALLWLIPVPHAYVQDGAWAGLAMFAAFLFYHRFSRNLSWAMAALFIVLGVITAGLDAWLGFSRLLHLALTLLAAALIAQFIGYRFEGRHPAWLTHPIYLLIGPAWLMSKLLQRAGIAY
jgi:uncharacterized membrane protein YGL010W